MKKYLLIIICFFTFQNIVKAEVYYGEYRKVENITNLDEDLIKIEKYKIYNSYKKEYIDLGYMEENKEHIVDYNDYIEEEIFSDNYKETDEYINIRVSKEKTSSFIFNAFPYRAKIYELEIYNKEELINYDIYSYSIFGSTLNNLYDNDYNTYFYNTSLSYMSPLLKNQYILEDLKIVIYTDVENDYQMNFIINGNTTPLILNNSIKRKHIITFDYLEDYDINENYEADYKYLDKIKLYKHYKENKIKTNIYIKEGENILLEDYKEIEEYYIRDKLVLEDIIEINDKTKNIEDFIIYKSDDTTIYCNIKYDINGVYECSFELNDIKVKKEVIVNINKQEESSIEENLENEEPKKDHSTKYEEIKENIENQEKQKENENLIQNIEINGLIEEKLEIENKGEVIEKENNIITPPEINFELENEYKKNNENIIKNVNEKIKDELVIKNKKEKTLEKIDNNKITNKKENNSINNVKVAIKNLDSKEEENKSNKLIFIKYILFINFMVLEIILLIRKKRNRNNVERV